MELPCAGEGAVDQRRLPGECDMRIAGAACGLTVLARPEAANALAFLYACARDVGGA